MPRLPARVLGRFALPKDAALDRGTGATRRSRTGDLLITNSFLGFSADVVGGSQNWLSMLGINSLRSLSFLQRRVEFLPVLQSWHTFGTHGILGGLVQIAVLRTLRPRTFSCYRGLCLPERSQYGAKDFPTGIALQSAPRRHNFRDLGAAGPAGTTRFPVHIESTILKP
jgi:hypothetical protein